MIYLTYQKDTHETRTVGSDLSDVRRRHAGTVRPVGIALDLDVRHRNVAPVPVCPHHDGIRPGERTLPAACSRHRLDCPALDPPDGARHSRRVAARWRTLSLGASSAWGDPRRRAHRMFRRGL